MNTSVEPDEKISKKGKKGQQARNMVEVAAFDIEATAITVQWTYGPWYICSFVKSTILTLLRLRLRAAGAMQSAAAIVQRAEI